MKTSKEVVEALDISGELRILNGFDTSYMSGIADALEWVLEFSADNDFLRLLERIKENKGELKDE